MTLTCRAVHLRIDQLRSADRVLKETHFGGKWKQLTLHAFLIRTGKFVRGSLSLILWRFEPQIILKLFLFLYMVEIE